MAIDQQTTNAARALDHMAPATHYAQLGQTQLDIIASFNALLAKLDTANVAGIGNNNAATLGLLDLGKRTPIP